MLFGVNGIFFAYSAYLGTFRVGQRLGLGLGLGLWLRVRDRARDRHCHLLTMQNFWTIYTKDRPEVRYYTISAEIIVVVV